MLYLVGLGLSDETDITVKGLEIVKKASRVYLEAYTSILLVDQSVLVRFDFSLSPQCRHHVCFGIIANEQSKEKMEEEKEEQR